MLRNLIFDLGGVVLNLDYARTFDPLKTVLGLDSAGRTYPKNYVHLFNNYEKGSLGEASFFFQLGQLSGRPADPAELKEIWNRMLLDLPFHRLELIRELRKKYRVVLLSNTNTTHLEHFYGYLNSRHGCDDFDTRYFDRTFYSHLLGMRKPDLDIFVHVMNECGFKANETLFIDDRAENLVEPQKLGITTVHHPGNSDLEQSLRPYI